jgi:GNAT superfamily N-acetyltransferase
MTSSADNIEIVELESVSALKQAFPLIKQLRPHLDEERYFDLLADMIPEGYRMFAVREGEALLAVAGIAVTANLYHDRHVWVYDLVTDEGVRSRGVGRLLLEYIETFARERGCKRVSLASGFQRTDAHRFYEERMGYDRVSYIFTKEI